MNRYLRMRWLTMIAILMAIMAPVATNSVFAQGEISKPAPAPRVDLQDVQINSAPLDIRVNSDLSQGYDLFGFPMFFADFDAGAFLTFDGQVYGPQPAANRGFQPIPYTFINQESGGSGTIADPFYVETEVAAGDTGLRLIQINTYVAGSFLYTNDFRIENDSDCTCAVRLTYAADLYANFADNFPDFGYGFRNPFTGAIGSISYLGLNAQLMIPDPATPPTAYQVSDWGRRVSSVPFWNYIGGSAGTAGPGLQNRIDSSYHDTVAGFQWDLIAPPAQASNALAQAQPGVVEVRMSGAFGSEDQTGITLPEIPTTEAPLPTKTAKIAVAQRPTPNHGVAPGSIVSYQLVITNSGDGSARDATITMPFDPTEVQLLDATFSTPQTWVSNVAANSLTIRTGSISAKNGKVTGIVRFRVLPTAPLGAGLGERLTVSWTDEVKGGNGLSNLPILSVAAADDQRQTYTLSAEPASGPVGSTYLFAGTIFTPKEPVGVWWNLPDGSVEAGPTFYAEDDGSLAVRFDSGNLPAGAYSMVFYGHWTEFTGVGAFTIQGSASSSSSRATAR